MGLLGLDRGLLRRVIFNVSVKNCTLCAFPRVLNLHVRISSNKKCLRHQCICYICVLLFMSYLFLCLSEVSAFSKCLNKQKHEEDLQESRPPWVLPVFLFLALMMINGW